MADYPHSCGDFVGFGFQHRDNTAMIRMRKELLSVEAFYVRKNNSDTEKDTRKNADGVGT